MKLTISRYGYTSKPEPITIKWMQSPELQAKTQPAFEMLDCSIEQFADKLRSGHSWRACNAKSGKKEDVYEAYSVAIDIDDATQPPEDYISRCEMMGFVPNIMYYSFSHGAPQYAGTYRFRLVWCFEQPITPAHWRTIATVLIKYFDADAACKNENRLWHGTNKQVQIIKEEYTNPDVFGGLIINAKLDSGSRVKDARKSKKDGCKDWVDNYCAATDVVKVETNGAWEKDLMRVCPLWKMWCNGEYLNYDERLMLWQNLKFLRPANKNTSIIDVIWKYYNDETYKTHTLTREQIAEKMRDTSLNPYRICCGNSLSVGEWLMQRNKPFANKLEKCTLEELDKEAKMGGWTVFQGKKYTNYGVATAAVKLVNAILSDSLTELPVSNFREEYGVYLSYPAVVGRDGVVEQAQLDLTEEELQKLQTSADFIKEKYQESLQAKD